MIQNAQVIKYQTLAKTVSHYSDTTGKIAFLLLLTLREHWVNYGANRLGGKGGVEECLQIGGEETLAVGMGNLPQVYAFPHEFAVRWLV